MARGALVLEKTRAAQSLGPLSLQELGPLSLQKLCEDSAYSHNPLLALVRRFQFFFFFSFSCNAGELGLDVLVVEHFEDGGVACVCAAQPRLSMSNVCVCVICMYIRIYVCIYMLRPSFYFF